MTCGSRQTAMSEISASSTAACGWYNRGGFRFYLLDSCPAVPSPTSVKPAPASVEVTTAVQYRMVVNDGAASTITMPDRFPIPSFAHVEQDSA